MIKDKLINIPMHYLFLILAIIESILFSFLMPINQTPDEHHHIDIIFDEMGVEEYKNDIYQYFNDIGVEDVKGVYDNKINKTLYFDLDAKFHKRLSLFDLRLKYTIIRHIPSAIGLCLGMFLDLPIFMCLVLAEFTSIIFYLIFGVLTLKKIPLKKDIFLFVLLMPMMIQQASSVGYDNTVNSLSIFLIAYILSIYYSEKNIVWSSIVVISIITFIIAITKIPYVIISVLIFLIPRDRWNIGIGKVRICELNKKYIIFLFIAVFLMCIVFLYFVRNIRDIKIFRSAIMDPCNTVRLIFNSFNIFSDFYIRSLIGNFGALDSNVHRMFLFLFVIILTYINGFCENDICISIKDRIVYILTGMVVIAVIFVALLTWTYSIAGYSTDTTVEVMLQINREFESIQGVQGRYFIPIIPLLLLGFSGNNKKTVCSTWIMVSYYVISYIHIITVLVTRYWK